ncbi:MAG: AAA-associated domain-containing protein [Thermoleophilaceae bacterium]|nr:AAA-associated domain-containing protein [Thermoleophilaceae bacterium]
MTLIDGNLLVELLAEHEIGVRRQSRPVLQLDEITLAGGSGGDDGEGGTGTSGRSPPGMYRSLWPLPGGNQTYRTALERLLPLAADQPTPTGFVRRLQHEFPQVESVATAKGYIRVLVALGFVTVNSGQISLTPDGREFVETQDIELVREALRTRIVGVKELVDELEHGTRTMEQLQQVLTDVGLAWETSAQLGWRLHWLESVGLVAAENGLYRLLPADRPNEL